MTCQCLLKNWRLKDYILSDTLARTLWLSWACESLLALASEQDMLGGDRCCRRQLPSRRHGRLVSAAVGTSGKCRLVGLGTEYSVTLFPSITATATDNPTFSTSRHTFSLLFAHSSSLLSFFYSGSFLLLF